MKQIPLTHGLFALVDDEDYEYLSQFHWYAHKSFNTYYAKRNVSRKLNSGKQKHVLMHREILKLTDTKIQIDHKDTNGLNNQRNNIRIVTNAQNQANRPPYKNGSSKFKGVRLDKRYTTKKWEAKITKNGKVFHLGIFENEIDAAIAFNKKAIELNGNFAYLNNVAQ